MKRYDHSGFTLVELMVVGAIIAIGAAMAFPIFLKHQERIELKRAGRSVLSDLQSARINSFRDTTNWAVQFTDSGYKVLSAPGSGGDWSADDAVVFKEVTLSDFGRISPGTGQGPRPGSTASPSTAGTTYNNDRVVFNPNGTTVVPSGTVYVKNESGDTFAVGTIAATGRVKVWVNYGSGWKE